MNRHSNPKDAQLINLFLPHLDQSLRQGIHARVPLERCLQDVLRCARETWPDLDIPTIEFLSFLAGKIQEPGDIIEALGKLFLSDLYLAFGCILGLPAAIAAFQKHVRPKVQNAIRRAGGFGSVEEDIEQKIWELLLVCKGQEPPRISQYAGRAELSSWVRVIATREARHVINRGRREVPSTDELQQWPALDEDEEIRHLKKTYRLEFKTAFQQTLADLNPRERNLLRQHTIDGLSIDQIGAFYRVHRATAARWLERIRLALLSGTRKRLLLQLQVNGKELNSIMTLIQSKLEVSIRRFVDTPSVMREATRKGNNKG